MDKKKYNSELKAMNKLKEPAAHSKLDQTHLKTGK